MTITAAYLISAPSFHLKMKKTNSLQKRKYISSTYEFGLARKFKLSFKFCSETTTLNPLSFYTSQTTTTTLDPIQQEIRAFQEELANRGIHEQQQLSLGLGTTSTTTTTTTTPSPDPHSLDSDSDSFLEQTDSTFQNTEAIPESLVELHRYQPQQGRYSEHEDAPAQSYSYVRTYRRRRSIDRQQGSENEVDDLTVSSTASPQQALVNTLLQDTNPREDLAKIGGWLFDNLARTVERNIANFAEANARPRSIGKPPPFSTPANFFLPAYKPTPRPLKLFSYPDPPSNYLSPEYHSFPKPGKNFIVSEQDSNHNLAPVEASPNLFQEYQPTLRPIKNIVPVESTSNLFQEYQSTAKLPKQFISTELPPNLVPVTYTQTPPKIDLSQFQWNVSPTISYENAAAHAQSAKIDTATYSPSSTTTIPGAGLPLLVVPSNTISSTTLLPKIRNVQIVPTARSLSQEPLRAYEGIYSFDQPTTPRSVESTTVYVQPSIVTSTENDASIISSLFKAKMNSGRDVELQKGFLETQQPNQFFDLLAQSNVTASPNGVDASSTPLYSTVASVTPSTAIFVRQPEDEPSSTAGYIFDKTITSKHKKESNYASKKNSRSPQMLKSTLVYRTPPGKRATLTRSELLRNEQLEAGLLSHILEAQGKPISSWLLGQPKQTTTGRPLVSAFMNLMRKRSPVH